MVASVRLDLNTSITSFPSARDDPQALLPSAENKGSENVCLTL